MTKKVNLTHNPQRAQRQTELVLEYRRTGSQFAFLDLLKSVDGLIALMYRRYSWCGVPREDFFAEASVAILRAVERFDAERGPFSAIALSWIQTSFRDLARGARPVSIANSRVETRLHTHGSRLYHELLDLDVPVAAAIDAVAEEYGLDPLHVAQAMAIHGDYDRRLDAWRGDDDDRGLELEAEERAPLDLVAAADTASLLREVLAELPERHRRIVEMRYLTRDVDEPVFVSLDVIGAELGVTRERIRKQHGQALEMLRKALERRGLDLDDLI